MRCACADRVNAVVQGQRQEARRRAEVQLPRQLDAFAAALRLGAVQLVARHMVAAGVFRASIDAGGRRTVTADEAFAAVNRAVADRPPLARFAAEHRDHLHEQLVYVDPQELLRGPLVRKAKAMEALGGYLKRQLDAAESMLQRLQQLEARLPAWKTAARASETVALELVMDPHEVQWTGRPSP